MAQTETAPAATTTTAPAGDADYYAELYRGTSMDDPAQTAPPAKTEQQPPAEVEPEPTEPETEPETVEAAPDEATDIEALIQQFAKETGLNPNDPAQRKTLERLANKEAHIKKLEAQIAARKQPEEEEPLTDIEKALLEAEAEQTPQPEKKTPPQTVETAPQPPLQPGQYGDVGDSWRSAEDAYNALFSAYQEYQENKPGAIGKIADVEHAMFMRRFGRVAWPVIVNTLEARLKDFQERELGPLRPIIEQMSGQMRLSEVKASLAQAYGDKFTGMFEPADDQKLDYDGQKFDNTPFNRVCIENPHIFNIEIRNHPKTGKPLDPATAEKMTNIARYKAAMRLLNRENGIPREKAQELVKAGATMQKRAADKTKVRQAMNAGPSKPGGATAADEYTQGLLNPSTDGLSVDELFRR